MGAHPLVSICYRSPSVLITEDVSCYSSLLGSLGLLAQALKSPVFNQEGTQFSFWCVGQDGGCHICRIAAKLTICFLLLPVCYKIKGKKMSWQLSVEDEYVYSAVCHAVCTVLGFECPVWNELFMPKLYLYVGEGGKIQIIPAF